MIKYPVKTNSPRPFELDVVEADGSYICSVPSKELGDAIANSLNAMNEFPDVSNDGDALIDWISKYIKE